MHLLAAFFRILMVLFSSTARELSQVSTKIPKNLLDTRRLTWTSLGRQTKKRARKSGLFLDANGHLYTETWCPEEDSNLHASRHTDLNRARLPIPPPGPVTTRSGEVRRVWCGADVSGRRFGVNCLLADFSLRCELFAATHRKGASKACERRVRARAKTGWRGRRKRPYRL